MTGNKTGERAMSNELKADYYRKLAEEFYVAQFCVDGGVMLDGALFVDGPPAEDAERKLRARFQEHYRFPPPNIRRSA